MEVNSILNTGIQGFQEATNKANEAAQKIASQSISDSSEQGINQADLANELVNLKSAEIDAKANARVIETSDEVLGTLLDIKA